VEIQASEQKILEISLGREIVVNYSLLLAPFRIGNLTLPNRIVMPPMVTFLAKDDGLITPAHIDHYKRSSGPGLVIVEGTAVLPEARVSKRQLGIYSDRHIEGFAQLAQIIHASGAVAGIQLYHAGAVAFQEKWRQKYIRIIGILFRLGQQHLMVSGLQRIREAFKVAARGAVMAGFDIVEIHGAHGYLFSQFLSPLKNWRIDRYGGKLENRRRFLLEVYRDVCSEVAERALATCRLGVADGHKGGLSLSEGLSTAFVLEKEGAKLIDVSSGSGTPSHVRPEGSPYSSGLHLARAAKQALSIPVIGGGGVRHPDHAEQALQDRMADLIYVGRGILADPAWAQKTIEGKPDSIVLCRDCRVCFHYTDPSTCPVRRKQSC
jgi:2,4-dienoyl-CoA reductase-like NADH-dependent reductase (Old Yellow Enzyme family)